jgi:predicted small secreted protein
MVHMTKAIQRNTVLIRSAFAGLMLAAAVLSLSACNTVHGAGKDLSNAGTATGSAVDTAGTAVSNTATNVQQKM